MSSRARCQPLICLLCCTHDSRALVSPLAPTNALRYVREKEGNRIANTSEITNITNYEYENYRATIPPGLEGMPSRVEAIYETKLFIR